MKKIAIILCVILTLSFAVAFAEEPAITIQLWEHTFINENEKGEPFEQTVRVSLTTKDPVDMTIMQSDITDGFIGVLRRKGVAAVSVAVYPADIVQANLKDASEEDRQEMVDYMAVQYEEGDYTVEVIELENENIFISVGSSNIRSYMTDIENVEVELIQAHFDEHFSDLTEEDRAFVDEILKGIEIK